MSKKILGFASRKVAAFLVGMVVGLVVGGYSVFGPGIGASVYCKWREASDAPRHFRPAYPFPVNAH